MATLLSLSEQDRVARFEPALRWDQQAWRSIYLLPKAQRFLSETLPGLMTVHEQEISPLEQVDAFLNYFCAGEPLVFDLQFHPLFHIDSAVWELKTQDVRLFGWFHKKDCFVCTNGGDATWIKENGLYAGFRDEAVRLRRELDLDEPKYIAGDSPHDVVSDFRFPPPSRGSAIR